jgi:hypothetical protein
MVPDNDDDNNNNNNVSQADVLKTTSAKYVGEST